MATYFPSAYACDTGRTFRGTRADTLAEAQATAERVARERLAAHGPWEWVHNGRGHQTDDEWEGGHFEGDVLLVVEVRA